WSELPAIRSMGSRSGGLEEARVVRNIVDGAAHWQTRYATSPALVVSCGDRSRSARHVRRMAGRGMDRRPAPGVAVGALLLRRGPTGPGSTTSSMSGVGNKHMGTEARKARIVIATGSLCVVVCR